MICHVCHKEACGQCKACLRFYCPQHGDRTCVACQGLQNDPPPAPPPALEEERRPGYPSVAYTGPVCYACSKPAHRACTRCGGFYCEEHGPVDCGSRCQGCSSFEMVWGCISFVIVGTIMAIAFASMRRW